MGDEHLDRRDVADHQHRAPGVRRQQPLEAARAPAPPRRGTTRRRRARRSSEPSHASSSSGCRSRDLGEGQPVPGAELHLGEPVLGRPAAGPSRSARISADSRVRRTGEVTTTSISLGQRGQPVGGRPDLRAALRRSGRGCCRPGRRRSACRRCASVTPCRTSTSVVGVPRRRTSRARRRPAAALGAGRGSSAGPAPRPAVPACASSASLRIRSACLFCSRGIQVYVVPNGASRVASHRQRPHVRVLDLPAARHLLDDELGVHPDLELGLRACARGRARARRSGRSTPRRCWSRCRCARPARRSPRRCRRRAAPRRTPPGPGLPRDPPSASTSDGAVRRGHQMPDSAVRTRIRLHSSQRSTSSRGAFAIDAEVGRGRARGCSRCTAAHAATAAPTPPFCARSFS